LETINKAEFSDIVGMCDPASGKLTKEGCQSAIVIVAQIPDGRAFALAEWADKCATDVITRNIFLMNRMWRCHRFGIDSTGQQNLYFQDVVKEANIRRERIALVPREMPSTENKEFRLTSTIQRWMHNGLLYVNESCPMLYRQLERYPTGFMVDLVDALSECLRMLRDPLANRGKLEYDPIYNEETRWQNQFRGDPRYGGFSR
jgi:predicted phage terminase large subunit-like protein